MASFVAAIGIYLKDVVLVPLHENDKEISQEVAMAYEEFSDLCGPDGPEIAFSTDGKVETLTVQDSAGREVSFAWGCSGVGLLYVDRKQVRRMENPAPWEIQRAIGKHFREWTGPQPRQSL